MGRAGAALSHSTCCLCWRLQFGYSHWNQSEIYCVFRIIDGGGGDSITLSVAITVIRIRNLYMRT